MTEEELIQSARQEGFAAAAVVKTSEIPFNFSFRSYCEKNTCGMYGKNYSCPPHCGSPEEMRQRLLSRPRALVLQTVWEIPDLSDQEKIRHARLSHNTASLHLGKKLQQKGCDGFLAGASCCVLCESCEALRQRPCPFPELRYSCLSAYCVYVKKLAESCGMGYMLGDGKVAFFSLYVCD